MRDRTTSEFWARYGRLPKDVQALADRSFEPLKADRSHPSVHYKRVGPFWSARVSSEYRCLGVDRGEDVYWFWIGRHDEYLRLIARG